MQLQIDIINIKFGMKLSQQLDILLWNLCRKCQLPELKMKKNLIDDFYRVTGETNCYTVSTSHEYLRRVWNQFVENQFLESSL